MLVLKQTDDATVQGREWAVGDGRGGSGVVVMTGENQACDVIISKIKKKWQNPSKVLVSQM